jgi:hypothetical protein
MPLQPMLEHLTRSAETAVAEAQSYNAHLMGQIIPAPVQYSWSAPQYFHPHPEAMYRSAPYQSSYPSSEHQSSTSPPASQHHLSPSSYQQSLQSSADHIQPRQYHHESQQEQADEPMQDGEVTTTPMQTDTRGRSSIRLPSAPHHHEVEPPRAAPTHRSALPMPRNYGSMAPPPPPLPLPTTLPPPPSLRRPSASARTLLDAQSVVEARDVFHPDKPGAAPSHPTTSNSVTTSTSKGGYAYPGYAKRIDRSQSHSRRSSLGGPTAEREQHSTALSSTANLNAHRRVPSTPHSLATTHIPEMSFYSGGAPSSWQVYTPASLVPITPRSTGIMGEVRSTAAEANTPAPHVTSLEGTPSGHRFAPLPPPPMLNSRAPSHPNVLSAQVGSSYGGGTQVSGASSFDNMSLTSQWIAHVQSLGTSVQPVETGWTGQLGSSQSP